MNQPDDPKAKNEAAQALSALGASKGGRARREVLSADERTRIAKQAAAARWGKTIGEDSPPEATVLHGPAEMPYSMFAGTLPIGDRRLECHVLSDNRRVFTQRAIVGALSPRGRTSGDLKVYLSRNPLIPNDFLAAASVVFQIPNNPNPAHGLEATALVDVCEKYIEAAEKPGALRPNQRPLAQQAGIIIRACAKVGIIALVDEATGYQEHRAKQALQLKLHAFIAEDMQEWAKVFPDDFWYELARLEGIHYSPRHRPIRWGKYVMAFVYDAIDADVGKELRKINPEPRHRQNHHQWLKTFGKERVHRQLGGVVAIMKLCADMDEFRDKFKQVFRKASAQQLSFDWGD